MRGEPVLVENVDFVTMETYAADMKAAGDRAGLVCGNLRQELAGLRFIMWALLMAAGGKVEIPCRILAMGPSADKEVLQTLRGETGGLVMEARLR